MTTAGTYLVALFNSVSHVMKAERMLKDAGVPHKIIPVPKAISADCGVCIRFKPEQREMLILALGDAVEVSVIRELKGV